MPCHLANCSLAKLDPEVAPFQFVPFLLVHRYPFHPSAVRLSRGAFYFGQLETSHCGATNARLSVIKMPFAKRVRRLRAGSVGPQTPFNYIKSD